MEAIQQQLTQFQVQTQAHLSVFQNQINLLLDEVACARKQAAIANNGASLDPEHPLMVVRMGAADPIDFPATVGELREISGQRLANLLLYYQIPDYGSRSDKIRALGRCIGARRIM